MDATSKKPCNACNAPTLVSDLTVVMINDTDEIKEVCSKCQSELDCTPVNASFGDGSVSVDVDF